MDLITKINRYLLHTLTEENMLIYFLYVKKAPDKHNHTRPYNKSSRIRTIEASTMV
jgi:hypothetical protein